MRIRDLDITGASKQDIFDIVVFMLLKQGRQATGASLTDCYYRKQINEETTLACGIGQIIPDVEYHERLEMKTVKSLLEGQYDALFAEAGLGDALPSLRAWANEGALDDATDNFEARIDFLRALQSEHDSDVLGGHDWLAQFRRSALALALRYGLNASILSFGVVQPIA